MLLVSRYVGEGLVLGDHIFVKLAKIGPEAIELVVRDEVASATSSLCINKDEWIEISPEIRLGFSGVREAEKGQKAQLAIEVPVHVPVHRKEVWDAL
jgi:sRNA-binding carbon storage regulator CsrA